MDEFDDSMAAEYDRDMKLLEQQATEALQASGVRPLTPEEQACLACLAFLAGIGNNWRENRT